MQKWQWLYNDQVTELTAKADNFLIKVRGDTNMQSLWFDRAADLQRVAETFIITVAIEAILVCYLVITLIRIWREK